MALGSPASLMRDLVTAAKWKGSWEVCVQIALPCVEGERDPSSVWGPFASPVCLGYDQLQKAAQERSGKLCLLEIRVIFSYLCLPAFNSHRKT